MVEGVAVAVLPGVADEGGDEEEEGAFGLMEVGYEAVDDVVLVAGSDEELGVAVEGVGIVAVEPIEDV